MDERQRFFYIEQLIKLVFRAIIPIALLAGGLILISLRISGWSLIYGLPLLVFGMVMLIFTYDEVVSKTYPPITAYSSICRCIVCGKATPCFLNVDPKNTICYQCQLEIRATRLKKEKNHHIGLTNP